MNSDDLDLVGKYAAGGADEAFAELVRRHINLVYSAALRRLGNPHEAEEVTQAVFIILAKKAAQIGRGTILSGWLYQTAQFTAANFQRSKFRRHRHEQEALMQFVQDSEPDASWQRLQPLLEEAMSHLGQKERDAVVLHFFENRTVGEVASALAVNEAAAQKRVNRATEKLRKFFTRRGVAVSAGVLTAAIGANSIQAAPAGLATAVTTAAVVKGAAASISTLTLIQGTIKVMAWTKIKTSVVVGVVVLLTAGATVATVKGVHAIRAAGYPNIQGAWQGNLAINRNNVHEDLRLVLRVVKTNGTYQAVLDSVDQGAKDIPITKFTYDYPKLQAEIASIDGVFQATFDPSLAGMSGTWKQAGMSFPLKLSRTAEPSTIPEPLAQDEFAQRANSDLQGYWKGTLEVGKASLRLALKIAEHSDGTFVAQLDSIDQGAKGLPVSSVTYDRPTMQLDMTSIGAHFDGTVNGSDTKLTGTWKQGGKSFPLVFSRADEAAEQAKVQAMNYSHSNESDLQGHWQGVLKVKTIQLHLKMDIGQLPDNTYACTLTSVDQGANEIPANSITYSAPAMVAEWKGLGASYKGNLAGGKLTGTFFQAGKSLPLSFERSR